MISGIYQITFLDGSYYIGKSENIEKRWKTHKLNFSKGTHTKKMQLAYNQYGPPEYTVLLPVHPDHIDLYEAALINQHWTNKILNTTKPRPMSPQECEQLLELYRVELNDCSVMFYSTTYHVEAIKQLDADKQAALHKCAVAEDNLGELESEGIVLPHEHQQKLKRLQQENYKYLQELNRLARLSWWQRLVDYKVYV